jgi:hypothetical protein
MLTTWARRILVAAPFAVATVLTVLMGFADQLHLRSERVAGYGFLFATPWAWLLDHIPEPIVHTRWLRSLIGYAIILWIPAVLYSACLWGLWRLFGRRADRVRG